MFTGFRPLWRRDFLCCHGDALLSFLRLACMLRLREIVFVVRFSCCQKFLYVDLVFLMMMRRIVKRSLRRPVVNRIAPIDGSDGRQVEEMSTGIWSQRRQIHLAAARQTEATVSEYVTSILRIAVKATSASTDLTRDPAGRACGPASSEDLEQMLEELMQEGRPNVPSEVKREEEI